MSKESRLKGRLFFASMQPGLELAKNGGSFFMRIRARLIVLIFSTAILFLGLRPYDALIGTWKINQGGNSTNETRFGAGFPAPKSQVCIFEAVGTDGFKYTQETVWPDGKSAKMEYTAQMDGKDYPVTGDPNSDSVSLKRIKPHMVEGTIKKAGQATSTFTIILWGNGLLMTVESKDTRDGKVYENRAVYNKVLPSP